MTISTPSRSHTACKPAGKPARGFTLLEMAVVLAIVGLLLGGLVPIISGQP